MIKIEMFNIEMWDIIMSDFKVGLFLFIIDLVLLLLGYRKIYIFSMSSIFKIIYFLLMMYNVYIYWIICIF